MSDEKPVPSWLDIIPETRPHLGVYPEMFLFLGHAQRKSEHQVINWQSNRKTPEWVNNHDGQWLNTDAAEILCDILLDAAGIVFHYGITGALTENAIRLAEAIHDHPSPPRHILEKPPYTPSEKR